MVKQECSFYGWNIGILEYFSQIHFSFSTLPRKYSRQHPPMGFYNLLALSKSVAQNLLICWWSYYLFYLPDQLNISFQYSFPNYLFNILIELCFITGAIPRFFYIPKRNGFINVMTQYRDGQLPKSKQKLKILMFLSKWKPCRTKWTHYMQKAVQLQRSNNLAAPDKEKNHIFWDHTCIVDPKHS